MNSLQLVLLLLGTSVLAIILFRRMHLPPILGYLMVGGIIGPHAFNLMHNVEEVRSLAEFGVVFLMFSIGLEFSFSKLGAMKRLVFGLGTLQMVGTMALITGIMCLLGFSWQIGLTIGGVISTASTAVLSKILSERNEIEAPHGKEVIGVLLFQDLAVVPLLIILPSLSQPPGSIVNMLLTAVIKAAVVLTAIRYIGEPVMKRWFRIVTQTKSSELFMLNVLLITLGLAYLTEMAGLSLALGAFVAGMLIAETDYHVQVEEDIKPFRDILMGLYFVTVGLYLDVEALINYWWEIGLFLVGLIFIKLLIMWGSSRLINGSNGTALRSGLWLCCGGEFGFVILSNMSGALSHQLHQVTLSALFLSMLIAPFIILYSERIVLKLVASEWQVRSMLLTQNAAKTMKIADHIIICGYGRSGQYLQGLLQEEGLTTLAIEFDHDRLKEAKDKQSVIYGDATRPESLRAAGIGRAKMIVVSVAEVRSAMKIIQQAKKLSPNIPIIVRTYDDRYLNRLLEAGATEVVPEYFEGCLTLLSHALVISGVPLRRIFHSMRTIRAARYFLLRDYYRSMADLE